MRIVRRRHVIETQIFDIDVYDIPVELRDTGSSVSGEKLPTAIWDDFITCFDPDSEYTDVDESREIEIEVL